MKPPSGTQLNLASRYARGLIFFAPLNEGGNHVQDLVGGNFGTEVIDGASTITWGGTPRGIAPTLDRGGSTDRLGWDFGDTGGSGRYEPTELTIITSADLGNEVDNGDSRIVSKRDTAGGGDDWSVQFGSSATEIRFRINGSNDIINPGDLDSLLGLSFDFALAVDSAGQDNYLKERDGALYTLLAQTGATVDQGTGNLCIGHREGEDRAFDGTLHYVAVWDHKKSQAEIERFWANPWQLLAPRLQLVPVSAGAAVGGVSPITATEGITFGESANVLGRGLVEGTEGIVFGESVDILGRGLIEATEGVVFSESVDVLGRGLIEATEAVVFGESADIGPSSGLIESTAAIVFGESANLIDINAGVSLITATEGIVFGESANITGIGAIEATEPVIFGEVAHLRDKGPLDATEPIIFGESVDILGRGLIEATEPLVFGESVNITGVGLVEGTAAVAFAESVNLTAVVVLTLAGLQQQIKDLEALLFADIIQP